MLQKDDLFIKIFLEMCVWLYHFASEKARGKMSGTYKVVQR